MGVTQSGIVGLFTGNYLAMSLGLSAAPPATREETERLAARFGFEVYPQAWCTENYARKFGIEPGPATA
jgi:hypothetical protein